MSKHDRVPTESTPTHVVDAGDLRKYRTELPNIIDDLDLSVYAYRLYGHLKRRAGANGFTIEGVRGMAKHCGISPGTAAKARQELIKRELIHTEEITNDRGRFERITIVDIWAQNFAHYAEIKHRKSKTEGTLSDGVYHETVHPPVSRGDTPGVSPDGRGVPPGESPGVSPRGTHKKEPEEERTNGERTTPPEARSNGNGRHAGVGGSKFSLESRKAYAKKHGLGPGWLNTSGDGRYDAGIELKLEQEQLRETADQFDTQGKPVRDTSLCPDCHGSGMVYVDIRNTALGVKKCTHPGLDAAIAQEQRQFEENRKELGAN